MNAQRCWFYAFLLIFSLTPTLLVAQHKPLPESELGSIRDPEDRPPSKNITETQKNILAISDEEMPEVPETLRWELALASKAYGISKTLRSTSDLITVLNKSIELLCFNELQKTLKYYPPPNDPACTKVTSILASVDPENPLLACVNTGIDTQECREGYLAQRAVVSIPSNITSAFLKNTKEDSSHVQFENDLIVKIEVDKMRTKLGDIRKALDKIKNQLAGKKLSADQRNQLLEQQSEKLTEILEVSCGSYRLVAFPGDFAKTIEGTKQITPVPSRNNNKSKRGSLEDLLNKGPFNENLIAAKQAVEATRFRIVSQACLNNLEQVEKQLPSLPAVQCYREGMTSPNCIQARRKAINPNSSAQTYSADESGSEGLERF